MARPTKSGDTKRELTIRVRVTEAEKNLIWQKAQDANLSPSDFLRSKSIGSTPARTLPSPERRTLLDFLAELGKIGSNINQIARALNRRQGEGELRGISEQMIAHSLSGVKNLTTLIMKFLQNDNPR